MSFVRKYDLENPTINMLQTLSTRNTHTQTHTPPVISQNRIFNVMNRLE